MGRLLRRREPPVQPSASVYARGGRVYAVPQERHESGIHRSSEPVGVSAPDPEAVGAAVRAALDRYVPRVTGELRAVDPPPEARAAGVKSWGEFRKGASLCSIRREGGSLLLQRWEPDRSGFVPAGPEVRQDAGVEDRVLGAEVLRCLGVLAAPPAESESLAVSFGYKMTWLAVRVADARRLAELGGLTEPRPAGWEEGVEAAYRGGVFATPPVDGWSFLVGTRLPGPETPEGQDLVKRASAHGRACLFSTHRVSDYHAWALAEEGILLRMYAWADGPVEAGERTSEEPAFDEESSPDEEDVMRVAGAWSLDPQTLDERTSPGLGLLGFT